MKTLAALKQEIKEIKAGRTLKQLKEEDVKGYYYVQGLTRKVSELKAVENKQFITKEHLVEFKPLIIWIMKNKCNYQNRLNLKEAMTSLLNRVEGERISFKTKRGIKGVVARLATSEGLLNAEKNLRDAYGFSMAENTYDNDVLSDFQNFRLSALM